MDVEFEAATSRNSIGVRIDFQINESASPLYEEKPTH